MTIVPRRTQVVWAVAYALFGPKQQVFSKKVLLLPGRNMDFGLRRRRRL